MPTSQSYYSVDRFEESENDCIAVLIDDAGNQQDVPASCLPEEATEGSCIVPQIDGTYKLDVRETATRTKRIRAKMTALFID